MLIIHLINPLSQFLFDQFRIWNYSSSPLSIEAPTTNDFLFAISFSAWWLADCLHSRVVAFEGLSCCTNIYRLCVSLGISGFFCITEPQTRLSRNYSIFSDKELAKRIFVPENFFQYFFWIYLLYKIGRYFHDKVSQYSQKVQKFFKEKTRIDKKLQTFRPEKIDF